MASPASSTPPSSPSQARSHCPLQPFPNLVVLKALKDAGISFILGTRNEDLHALASKASFTAAWVTTNVLHNAASIRFKYITAANEVIPGYGGPCYVAA